jgi:hypothetical protein
MEPPLESEEVEQEGIRVAVEAGYLPPERYLDFEHEASCPNRTRKIPSN